MVIEFKTLFKLAMTFQLNNADFPLLSSKYVSKAVSGWTEVPSSKFINNVIAKSCSKFVCVCKFVSVPMFAQSVCSPSYCAVKRCDFDFVSKVIINTRCSVSVCHKVRKSVLVSVFPNVFHASQPDVVNVTIVPPPYQHFNSTNNVSKSVLSASAVSFIPAQTQLILLCLHMPAICERLLTPHAAFVKWVLIFLFLWIPAQHLLIMFRIMYVMFNIQNVSFKSRVSVTSNFKYVSSSPLYTILVAILFNIFSFTQSAKAILVCNIFSIIELFLLVCLRFYSKNGGRLIFFFFFLIGIHSMQG